MVAGGDKLGEKKMIAPCGIDCSACNIFRAKDEPEVMKEILDWFREKRGIDLPPEKIRCDGCLGDRSVHWSSGCDILKCSVDGRGLSSCSECGKMPCRRLEDWASNGPKYAAALETLKAMRQGRTGR